MKSLQIHPYSLLLIVLLTVSGIQSDAQKLPELFYFQFDDTGRLMRNLADASTALSPFATLNSPLGEASGQFGSALRGVNQTAGTANCNTNVALQHTGGWTISMWVNGVGQSRSVSYFFGNAAPGSSTGFRCFAGGAAGAGSLTIRGGSHMRNVNARGIFEEDGSPIVLTIVYDPRGRVITVYKNGVPHTSTAQFDDLSISSTFDFLIGSSNTSRGALHQDYYIDEFRMYSRPLTSAEVAASWNVNLADPQPFTLNRFRARYDPESISARISWGAGFESGIPDYTIQRSVDGRTFKAIGGLPAKGPGSAYEYTDITLQDFRPGSYVYYRLRADDRHGKEHYSHIVRTRVTRMEPPVVTVSPNNFSGTLYIQSSFRQAETIEITLTDVSGRMLYRSSRRIGAGSQLTSLTDLTQLPPGPYSLVLTYGDTKLEKQVVKL